MLAILHPSRYTRTRHLDFVFGGYVPALGVSDRTLKHFTAALAGFGSANQTGSTMRYVYIVLIVAVTAAVLLFKIQNFTAVTVSLFSASVTMPVSLLILGIYLLGMLTGSMLLGVLRGWVRGATRKPY